MGCSYLPQICCCNDVGDGGARGASAAPKDLNCRKSGQNSWKSGQNWRQQFFRKTNEDLFFGGHTKKRSSWSLWEKICRWSCTITFGQVWGNSSKKPSHPQKFSCSYTYVLLHFKLFTPRSGCGHIRWLAHREWSIEIKPGVHLN